MKRYPIGIQTFEKIREGDFLYVDKTDYVYEIAHRFQFVFLSRPRRFGKSLLTTTFKSYFEGRKDLFEGLKASELEKEWVKRPVLHFDMSTAKHRDEAALERELSYKLLEYEKIYGREEGEVDCNQRLQGLIKRAVAQTGQKAVVLIDEYDAPLLDVLDDEPQLAKLRQIMRNFYSPLKACDADLAFVFLTGITKFSQLSIFSELNNIENVSMNPKFAAACGISEDELHGTLNECVEEFATARNMTVEEAFSTLKEHYDGYHFTEGSPDIYNPFSLLQALKNQKTESYWFGSGTPTYLVNMLRKFDMVPSELGGPIPATRDSFDAPAESLTSIIPLLYQSGYVTIKDFDEITELYTLGIPNREVRVGLMKSLLPNYIKILEANTIISRMSGYFYKDDIDGAFAELQTFFKTVPYCNDIDYEGHWQQMLYLFFSIFGARGDTEVHTSDGRVDMAFVFYGRLYLVEVKLDKTADEAIKQINLKEYHRRFALLNIPIVKVGVNFSTKERTITQWLFEKCYPE